MTRWASTLDRLDEAHRYLILNPAVTCDDFAKVLPKVPCYCTDPQYGPTLRRRGGICSRCGGAQVCPPERAVAYALLVKLEQDGRAERVKLHCAPHLWSARGATEAAVVDAYWDGLADLAPDDPVQAYKDMAAERDRVKAELDAICAGMDALVHGLVEALDRTTGGTLKALAADLGIHYSAVNGHRWRHWDRTNGADPDETPETREEQTG